MICLQQGRGETVLIRLYIQPRASSNQISGIHDGALKLRVTAPPVDGEANRMVISFFAKLFKVPKSTVVVTKGQNSRKKTITVTGVKFAVVEKILAAQISPSLSHHCK